ncbi:MAG: adenylyl-sulfate kinase [Candidatus Andersenbacteria bacterium]|nr:adenylyl-sulfate kinase [Candidatus Andersenbacteria bacterium]
MYMKEKYNFNAELLRMVIAGSVDDGKSTFIGRLFYDLQEIYDDQLEALEKSSLQQGKKEIDLSFFTDGLSAEREQKITIDVAYRYLSTSKRRFIIADVPGHEQYTPNMVTGASNASLALILVDARKGILPQSKRHLFIASLMGVSHILVVINKMDLVDYDQNVFEKIKSDFLDFTTKLNITDLQFIPASSLNGDMIVRRGENMNWHQGSTIISYLENLEIASDRNLIDFRFPVQLVIRPNQDFRGYAGQVEGGKISVGEKVMILPSEKKTTIKSIIIGNKRKSYAFNSQAAVLSLKDDLDISRGDVIVGANNLAELGNEFEAMVCWMSDKPMRKGGSYILKQMTKTTRCFIDEVLYRININNLHRKRTNALKFNEIGRVRIKTNEPIVFDPYHKNKNTGSFIIIDETTNNTVGAGVILYRAKKLIFNPERKVNSDNGAVLWFTGLSGSGKKTIADKVFKRLKEVNISCEKIDGDIMRKSLCRDLGFSKEDRDKNIERAVFVASLLSKHGVIVLATFISPYEKHRLLAKKKIKNFVEIFVNASLEICEKRDVKGLYKKARKNKIKNFTGISDVYENPKNPDIKLKTEQLSVKECTDKVIDYLKKRNLISS